MQTMTRDIHRTSGAYGGRFFRLLRQPHREHGPVLPAARRSTLMASGQTMGAEHRRTEPPPCTPRRICSHRARESGGNSGPANGKRKGHVALLVPMARAGQKVRFIRLSFVALVVVAAVLSARN